MRVGSAYRPKGVGVWAGWGPRGLRVRFVFVPIGLGFGFGMGFGGWVGWVPKGVGYVTGPKRVAG